MHDPKTSSATCSAMCFPNSSAASARAAADPRAAPTCATTTRSASKRPSTASRPRSSCRRPRSATPAPAPAPNPARIRKPAPPAPAMAACACSRASSPWSAPAGAARARAMSSRRRAASAADAARFAASARCRSPFRPGIEDGQRIRLAGEGEPGARNGPKGDLYIFVSVKEHELFERDGQTLFARTPVPMCTAALGGEIEMPTIDGGRMRVSIPEGAQTGKRMRLKGKGMPTLRGGANGDLVVELFVETPSSLTARQKELLRRSRPSAARSCHPESHGFFDTVKRFFDQEGFAGLSAPTRPSPAFPAISRSHDLEDRNRRRRRTHGTGADREAAPASDIAVVGGSEQAGLGGDRPRHGPAVRSRTRPTRRRWARMSGSTSRRRWRRSRRSICSKLTKVKAAIVGTTGSSPAQEQQIAEHAKRIAIVRARKFLAGRQPDDRAGRTGGGAAGR